jgi:N6-L-threonylcarbamoyladenine synthase
MSNLKPEHLILSIESSCDETSLALLAVPSFINKENQDSNFKIDDLELIRNTKILSTVIASQIKTHEIYGGVVPEIGARMHAEAIHIIWKEMLDKLDLKGLEEVEMGKFKDLGKTTPTASQSPLNRGTLLDTQTQVLLLLDKIMVTTNPGLVSALRVGQEFAKSVLFFADQTRLKHGLETGNLEICEINHLRGHVASSFYVV